jgi:uncharacterized protein (TIGR02001 family)
MTRLSWEVGIIKSCVLGAALAAAVALPAQAQDKKLTLSGTAVLTTDYIFRGISFTGNQPAVQASFNATYGIFYAGAWASNIELDGTSIEIDYYAGITPTWRGISFDIAALYYTYPGANDPLFELDYFEVKTKAAYTFAERLTLGVTNYWSPEFTAETGDADALELSAAYAFRGKLFNFFSPSISGGVGFQWIEELEDYTYWNVGLTLGFLEHWSVDVRYWDTDYSEVDCFAYTGISSTCDERVVGTLTATF